MQVLPRNVRLTAVAAFATIIIAVSAFAPAKEAPLSPRFNHVMLVVTNLDSSITFSLPPSMSRSHSASPS